MDAALLRRHGPIAVITVNRPEVRNAVNRLTLTGQPISAAEAQRWGLVNEVVEPADVLPAAIRLGTCVAENAPLAVRWSKRVVLGLADGSRVDEQASWLLNAQAAEAIRGSADVIEGARAFAEQRTPRWQGA